MRHFSSQSRADSDPALASAETKKAHTLSSTRVSDLDMRHIDPKTDDWREVHLAHVESLGSKLWLDCNICGHSMTLEPREFASEHHLDMKTPLLLIARRLTCTHCNARKAHCWPKPYGIEIKGP